MMTEMTHLIALKPDVAADKILRAIRAAGGSQRGACVMLGCHETTLVRWIAVLGIGERVRAEKEKLAVSGAELRRKGRAARRAPGAA